MMQPASAESLAFRKCYGSLYSGIQSPKDLVPHLYSAEILTGAKKDELMSHAKPITPLLDALEQQIKANPKVFHDFVTLLGREGGVTKTLCELLNDTYGEKYYVYEIEDVLAVFVQGVM